MHPPFNFNPISENEFPAPSVFGRMQEGRENSAAFEAEFLPEQFQAAKDEEEESSRGDKGQGKPDSGGWGKCASSLTCLFLDVFAFIFSCCSF